MWPHRARRVMIIEWFLWVWKWCDSLCCCGLLQPPDFNPVKQLRANLDWDVSNTPAPSSEQQMREHLLEKMSFILAPVACGCPTHSETYDIKDLVIERWTSKRLGLPLGKDVVIRYIPQRKGDNTICYDVLRLWKPGEISQKIFSKKNLFLEKLFITNTQCWMNKNENSLFWCIQSQNSWTCVCISQFL